MQDKSILNLTEILKLNLRIKNLMKNSHTHSLSFTWTFNFHFLCGEFVYKQKFIFLKKTDRSAAKNFKVRKNENKQRMPFTACLCSLNSLLNF